MLTLLMVLFLVLFAMSQVDQNKFNALRSGLATGFGAAPVGFTGQATKIEGSANEDSPMDLASGIGGKVDKTAQEAQETAIQEAVKRADVARQQRMQEHAQQEVDQFEEIKAKIIEELNRLGTAESVRFAIDERGLIVTVITSAVVFAGDRADLLPDGRRLIGAIGPVIAPLPNRIEVDGHTNQLPVPTVNYPSSWELSTARASTVVRYLHDAVGIPTSRLSAVGFADTKPLYDPADPRAPELNRRVEIVVQSTLPSEERALLPSAASSDPASESGSGGHD
jgi:chemotaxis protein MotB